MLILHQSQAVNTGRKLKLQAVKHKTPTQNVMHLLKNDKKSTF